MVTTPCSASQPSPRGCLRGLKYAYSIIWYGLVSKCRARMSTSIVSYGFFYHSQGKIKTEIYCFGAVLVCTLAQHSTDCGGWRFWEGTYGHEGIKNSRRCEMLISDHVYWKTLRQPLGGEAVDE